MKEIFLKELAPCCKQRPDGTWKVIGYGAPKTLWVDPSQIVEIGRDTRYEGQYVPHNWIKLANGRKHAVVERRSTVRKLMRDGNDLFLWKELNALRMTTENKKEAANG